MTSSCYLCIFLRKCGRTENWQTYLQTHCIESTWLLPVIIDDVPNHVFLTESVLELTNTSTVPLKWKFSSFAPAYVKGADENNTVQRVSYNVFQIIPSSGELLAQESIKVITGKFLFTISVFTNNISVFFCLKLEIFFFNVKSWIFLFYNFAINNWII